MASNSDETTRAAEDDLPPTRRSTVFERPPGNIFVVPNDGGPPLSDVSARPTILASVELVEDDVRRERVRQDPAYPPDER